MTIPDEIALMDEATARTFFKDTYNQIDTWRLMHPNEWKNGLAGTYESQWQVCTEVKPKIDSITGTTLLRKLAMHAFDVLCLTNSFGVDTNTV